ncbi:sulfurtransferase complex subunit TusC [Paraglaciecola psychrophila]|uniref:Sulfur relay protein TusC/DsrF n=1 Tax=Paraglaciecola psychrophila 170 TaxID=1129794 RepID=K7A8V1_9ALTE|nr:sulfurtransferase complex subunit TusC [Paraglaciecola psychrophila]AGH44663.1 sulfur relay protein TusC/DsrF [Paraglaciecola psychrophila 170]GAC37198.1 protein tusC [Paraglaciecola psychrophila 170]
MSHLSTSIAIINTSPPYGSSGGQESLDMALALSNFAQNVSVFFIEDGVLQLLVPQNPTVIDAKAYYKTFAALEFYDIENIYVCKQSLLQRGIEASQLCIPVTLIEYEDMSKLLSKQQHVMSF